MYRFGFVLSTSLGNATRYRIFKKFSVRDPDIDFTWAPVKHYYGPHERDPMSRVPRPFYSRAVVLAQSWPVLGHLKRFDAVMFHQLEAQPLALLRQMVANGPLIVAAQDNPPIIDLAGYPPYPKVVTSPWWRSKLRLKAELWAARQSSLHITFSKWQASVLVDKCGISPHRVHAIHTGLDLAEWPKPSPKPSNVKPSILFVGGDLIRKGGDILLRVFRDHFSGKATLDIVTTTAVEMVHPDIRIHNGLLSGDSRLKELYAKADIFVLPTRADLSPWVCLEAMASEAAMIATDVGGIADMVRDGVTGRLIKLEDPIALRSALDQLIENAPLRRSMGVEARRTVERNFDASINVQRILDLMKVAVDGRRENNGKQQS
jgi:glycosyltransferase involved in cell wall biosynthesis